MVELGNSILKKAGHDLIKYITCWRLENDGFGNTDSTIRARRSLSPVSGIHLFDKRRDINYHRLYQTVNKEAIVPHTWYGNRTECNMFDKDGVMTHFPIYGSEGQLLHLPENTRLITQIVTDDTFPSELFKFHFIPHSRHNKYTARTRDKIAGQIYVATPKNWRSRTQQQTLW